MCQERLRGLLVYTQKNVNVFDIMSMLSFLLNVLNAVRLSQIFFLPKAKWAKKSVLFQKYQETMFSAPGTRHTHEPFTPADVVSIDLMMKVEI